MTTTAAPSAAPPGPPPPLIKVRADSSRRRMARMGWGMSAPALIFIAVVTIFPIVFAVIMSLSHVTETASGFHLHGITGSNYSTVFKSSLWRHALWFTVYYTVITVIIELILGTLVALVLERLVRGRGPMMALLLIPWSLITVISAQLWGYIYKPQYGIGDTILHALGLGSPVLLQGSHLPTVMMMLADIWKTTPFVSILVLAGLVMLPDEVYEASEVDGANGWQTFWKVTFPLLRPTIGLAVLFRVLQAFGIFDLPYVLTQGGPNNQTTSLAILTFQALFSQLAPGPGTAVAITGAVLVVVVCLLFLRVFKAQVRDSEVR